MTVGTAGRGMRTAGAVVSVLTGLGFGLPCAWGIVHLSRTRQVWTFLGYPTYGGGPFERLGIETTVPLMAAFAAVCAAEVALAPGLRRGTRGGRTANWLLLPVEFVFWTGFALPAGPLLGVARTLLVTAGRRSGSMA
ncbi:MAG: hypothetical protein ACRDIU_00990 [Actinomycetota bacterium]